MIYTAILLGPLIIGVHVMSLRAAAVYVRSVVGLVVFSQLSLSGSIDGLIRFHSYAKPCCILSRRYLVICCNSQIQGES